MPDEMPLAVGSAGVVKVKLADWEFVGLVGGVLITGVPGTAVSIVHTRIEDTLELFVPSVAAPAAIWRFKVPLELGALRETVNVYGPAPEPVELPAVQADDEPKIVRSLVFAANPLTDSLKVTEQPSDATFVGDPLGAHEKAVTDGAKVSIV